MTKATGTAAELLNLPSGGGSVSGQGASVGVDLNTGAATTTYGFKLPAGPNGLTPPLALQYSTALGDGSFGPGWSLCLMAIRRRISASWAPGDSTATYSLVGVGDLIAMDANRFRPAIDTAGALIEFVDGAWTITDKTDQRCTLGAASASRLSSGTDAPAAWHIDSCTDAAGNAIAYTWLSDGGGLLPASIAWGTYRVDFVYEARPDIVIDGTYGLPFSLEKRCSTVELHVTTEAVSLVRSWSFGYDDTGAGRSLLTRISEAGHGADGSTLTTPDQTYGYSAAAAPTVTTVSGFTASLSDVDTDLADLSGDGLPDLVQIGIGLPTMRSNLGGGAFGPPRPLAQAPAPVRLSGARSTFADMSGDGNVDLLVLGDPLPAYYPLTAVGGGTPSLGRPVVFRRAPAVSATDPNVRFLDLNGDGITDILVDTNGSWLMYLRDGVDSWSEHPVVLPADRTPPVALSDPRVYLADITGDGQTDVVLATGGAVTYWPARADGGWGAAMEMSPSPVFAQDHDPRRLFFVDVDGDGCADLVYVGASVTVWHNIGATRLSAPTVIADTPPAAQGSFRLADVLGSGTPGVLFEFPSGTPGSARQAFLELTGGVKPYLLTHLSYGAARTTTITYQTSTEYARTDATAGQPWRTYHPFPVHCVARTDQVDHAVELTSTSTYEYHDGRYDPATRAFLGFGRVDSEQLGDAECPTLRVETTFHLGLDPADPTRPVFGDEALQLGALRRKPLATTVFGLDGSPQQDQPYSVTTHTYATKLGESQLPGGQKVAVPYCTTSVEQRWERQPAPISTRTVRYLNVTDDGDITEQRTIAQRTGLPLPDQDITTTTTLATGGTNLRLPARITQTDSNGTIFAETVSFYDGDPYVGLPEGQATAGLLTRTEDLMFTDDFVATVWASGAPELTGYGYHRMPGDDTGWWRTRRAHQRGSSAQGPTMTTMGALGAAQLVQYDQAGQRIVAVTDAVGNTVTAIGDPRVIQTASITDVNGHTVFDTFDCLGRVLTTVGPLDTAALPSADFSYLPGLVSEVRASTRVTHGSDDTVSTITWLDGSGRVLGESTPAAQAGQRIISRTTQRHTRGVTTATYLPYLADEGMVGFPPPPDGTPLVLTTFDALGRIQSYARPDGLTVRNRRTGGTVVTTEQWPNGPEQEVERQNFDAAGQLIVVSRKAGDAWIEQNYTYAPSGAVVAVTLPDATQVKFTVDLRGRMFRQDSPDSGTTTMLLDAADNERIHTNAAGQVVRSEVDSMNRLCAVFHDAETVPRVCYDYFDRTGAAPSDGITTNRYARLWQVTDELGSIVFDYDEQGRTTSELRTVAAGSQQFLTEATFDAFGRTTSLTLPATTAGSARRTVEYRYGLNGSPISASGIVDSATYDFYGRLTALRYANGTATDITYTADGGGVDRLMVRDASGAVLRDMALDRTKGFVTGLVSSAAGDDTAAFAYDVMRRLCNAAYTSDSGGTHDFAWAFDDSFNMTQSAHSGALSYEPGTHRLAAIAGVPTGFDAAGRRVTGGFGIAAFDAADRLTTVEVPDSQTLSHIYDYRSRRVRSLADGVETYLSPSDNIEIRDGHTVAWLQFGSQRIAAEIDGVLTILHPNALGEPDLLTDAAGAYLTRIHRTPFGGSRSGPDPGEPGVGAVVAALLLGTDGSGLVILGRRWYDPTVGQFLTPDPFVPSVYTVGAYSPYLLCLGNPISLSDPTGCSFWGVLEVIGIALLAAAAVTLVVATGGAALAGLSFIGFVGAHLLLMGGVAVGALGGALAGEVAAQKAGGNIWAGAFFGAVLGGTTALIGGALGGLAAGGVDSVMSSLAGSGAAVVQGTSTAFGYMASGIIQGSLAGAGTGLAVGFAGGKGNAEQMLSGMAKGALWGAALGGALGLGLGFVTGSGVTGTTQPDKYLTVGDFGSKFAKFGNVTDTINSIDNWGGLSQNIGGFATDPTGVGSLLPNFLTTGAEKSGILGEYGSLSLSWVQPAFVGSGVGASSTFFGTGFAAAVDLSMAADQAGFSYAKQFGYLIGAAPYFIDYAAQGYQMNWSHGYAKTEVALNEAFGSGS